MIDTELVEIVRLVLTTVGAWLHRSLVKKFLGDLEHLQDDGYALFVLGPRERRRGLCFDEECELPAEVECLCSYPDIAALVCVCAS